MGKTYHAGPTGGTLGSLFPDKLRQMAAQAPSRQITLTPGDVLWLKLPQHLSHAEAFEQKQEKFRPFILVEAVGPIQLDEKGCGTCPLTLLGVDGTSKPYLLKERPQVRFHIPGKDVDTFAMLDSMRTVSPGPEIALRPLYHLSDSEMAALTEGMDLVLQPEPRFYLSRLFNRNSMPGQVWRAKVGHDEIDVLILLRRGRYALEAAGQDGHTANTPFLAAAFRNGLNNGTLFGVSWDDTRIISVQERDLERRIATVSDDTVGIVLNTLRHRIGLPTLPFKQPPVRSFFPQLGTLLLGLLPGPRL